MWIAADWHVTLMNVAALDAVCVCVCHCCSIFHSADVYFRATTFAWKRAPISLYFWQWSQYCFTPFFPFHGFSCLSIFSSWCIFLLKTFFLLFGFDFSPIFFPSCHLIPVLCSFFPIQFNLRYTNALFVLPAHQCQTKLIAIPCCLTHVFLRVENSSIPFSPNKRIISFPKSLRFAYMLNFAFASRISQLFVVQIWLDSPRLKYLHRKSIGYVRSEFKSSFCSRS